MKFGITQVVGTNLTFQYLPSTFVHAGNNFILQLADEFRAEVRDADKPIMNNKNEHLKVFKVENIKAITNE